jgi:Zn finger protein HypA/HybF involved in hydrogenase expression
MHELSIATSILELARHHMPPGMVLRSVNVHAGPMRGIDPESIQLAWRACTFGSSDAGESSLNLEMLPSGDDLLLVGIEVDQRPP